MGASFSFGLHSRRLRQVKQSLGILIDGLGPFAVRGGGDRWMSTIAARKMLPDFGLVP
jgi:hypothetical protein